MVVLIEMKSLTPINLDFIDSFKWSAAWILRAHLPWDFICEMDIEDWLRENCIGKYEIKQEKAFSSTYSIFIAKKIDATHFALRWVGSSEN